MNALAARRRHPAAIAVLLILGLFLTGAVYTAVAPKPADATTAALPAQTVEEGKALFRANCASCHGLNAEGRATGTGDQIAGPPLAGVGAAAVDFQMGTGRMPMTAPAVQAPPDRDGIKFEQEEIDAIGAYIASLAPGPAVPSDEAVDPALGDPANGGNLFRVNCAMCHNFAGSGGALTRGKYAPEVRGVEGVHIYEAMQTGPQSMPVFSDENITPEDKRDIIAFLDTLDEETKPGGLTLGSLGPVTEGLFAWVFGLGLLVGCAVWLGSKAA
ncbi:c-type cytochrome [Phycicoccus sp. BSK3Z-2]|uniref:Cytochrome bc1 complex cytochrome c subunit n=1 Tax=Phycicoccus avicenniae TaxID=2828860 RepID=A0A941D978_9MICO|nr:cytochrome c [Phycicoccus avicenniae]MBR7743160.1 c-type cytochrome [Phycicoccus avicenniae]